MNYSDRPIPMLKWSRPLKTEAIKATGFSCSEITLEFQYERNSKPRKFELNLTKAEAQDLVNEINSFFEKMTD